VAVSITRDDLDAAGLRRAAARRGDAAAARRMLALALVLEGKSRSEAARVAGMDRQTLRDWVHRYNAEGLRGLSNRPHEGAAPRRNADQMAHLAALVEAGPDPVLDKVVRWRRVDLQAVISERFGVDLHERSVGKLLARLKFRKLSVRPQHPLSDPAVQEAFKNNFADHLRDRLRADGVATGTPVELWFQDEARSGQQGTLTRLWAPRGTRPRAPRHQRYKWA
jgi:transposase